MALLLSLQSPVQVQEGPPWKRPGHESCPKGFLGLYLFTFRNMLDHSRGSRLLYPVKRSSGFYPNLSLNDNYKRRYTSQSLALTGRLADWFSLVNTNARLVAGLQVNTRLHISSHRGSQYVEYLVLAALCYLGIHIFLDSTPFGT